MANEFLTAGITFGYCAETTAGTRPTTGYTVIPGVKGIPEFGAEPESVDVTDLSDTEFRRNIPGLADIGGAQGLTCNHTVAFHNAWDAFVTAYETAEASGKSVWCEIKIPGLSKSYFFAGIPSVLGFSGAEVGDSFDATAYVTVNQIEGYGTSST